MSSGGPPEKPGTEPRPTLELVSEAAEASAKVVEPDTTSITSESEVLTDISGEGAPSIEPESTAPSEEREQGTIEETGTPIALHLLSRAPEDRPLRGLEDLSELPAEESALDNLVVLPGLAGNRNEDDEALPASIRADGSLTPPPDHLLAEAVEAMLFAAEGPVSIDQLDRWLGHPGPARIRPLLHEQARRLAQAQGGIRLVQVAKGWQLRTDVRFAPWVSAMRGGKPLRLSRAAMDTLAILAYRQPVTRAEIEELRGVESGSVVRMLCERGLAMVVGRKDIPGRPLLYGTTRSFLSLFNLRDLSDLPTLRDLRELHGDRLPGDEELGFHLEEEPEAGHLSLVGEDSEGPGLDEPPDESAETLPDPEP